MDLSLFLGYPVNPLLEEKLQRANRTLLTLFTSGGDYLEFLQLEDMRFLGKKCPSLPSLQDLEDLNLNIRSLLLRLAPDYLLQDSGNLVIPPP